MSLGPFGGPERASGGPFCPRALIWTPPGNRKSASPSCSFPRPRPDPPRKPRFAQIHIFTMLFDEFSADRGPEMAPPGAPTDFATPPWGAKRAPKKACAGPSGPKGAPRASSRAPGDHRAAPNSGQPSQYYVLSYVPRNIHCFVGKVALVPVGNTFLRSKKGT